VGLEKEVHSKDEFLFEVFDIAVRHQSREVAVAIGNRLVAEGAASPAIYSELYDALWRLNKTSEAASVLEKGLSAFPTSHSILLKSARFAMAHHDYATASEKWILAHRAAPEAVECYLSGSVCLERINQIQDALDLIKTGIQRHPENTDLIRRSIEIDANIQNSDMRDILMCFESLGGAYQGCEFGNVQRHFGAEPLGLLRWAEMTPDNLLAALERGFEGVGEPENTILEPPRDDGDWMLKDARFGMTMHTFLLDEATEENRTRIFRLMCRRLRYLARKMLEDLTAGDKVFVYKISYENLCQNRLGRLHRALRMHGPSTLLYVRRSDPSHPPGTVIVEAPGLMVGYIERFAFDFGPHPKYLGPTPESWVPIVREAHRLSRDGCHEPLPQSSRLNIGMRNR
jgi:tetratricopeptide (TPR) repeat protein